MIYSALRREDILTHAPQWTNIMLHENSRSQKDKYGGFYFHEVLRVIRFMETESTMAGAGD